jgi:hypothetical protein
VHSLASEHLQELEDLVGPPRQKQEETVVAALGSLYRGKTLYSSIRSGTWDLQYLFSWFNDCAYFSDIPADFLPTPVIKTVSSINSLFLALVLFPQVQKRAQAELDVVVGRDRLPKFDDRPHLPYIEAIYKELMRWLMVAPTGMVWDFL